MMLLLDLTNVLLYIRYANKSINLDARCAQKYSVMIGVWRTNVSVSFIMISCKNTQKPTATLGLTTVICNTNTIWIQDYALGRARLSPGARCFRYVRLELWFVEMYETHGLPCFPRLLHTELCEPSHYLYLCPTN